jgi:hypothetical protein
MKRCLDEAIFTFKASLQDDDVVVYQTGTSCVDCVQVGDGASARLEYARVENVQIVWTHNCKHFKQSSIMIVCQSFIYWKMSRLSFVLTSSGSHTSQVE